MTDYIDSMSEQVSMCHSEDNWSKDFIGSFFMVYFLILKSANKIKI